MSAAPLGPSREAPPSSFSYSDILPSRRVIGAELDSMAFHYVNFKETFILLLQTLTYQQHPLGGTATLHHQALITAIYYLKAWRGRRKRSIRLDRHPHRLSGSNYLLEQNRAKGNRSVNQEPKPNAIAPLCLNLQRMSGNLHEIMADVLALTALSYLTKVRVKSKSREEVDEPPRSRQVKRRPIDPRVPAQVQT
jgi:hypothetical protein